MTVTQASILFGLGGFAFGAVMFWYICKIYYTVDFIHSDLLEELARVEAALKQLKENERSI